MSEPAGSRLSRLVGRLPDTGREGLTGRLRHAGRPFDPPTSVGRHLAVAATIVAATVAVVASPARGPADVGVVHGVLLLSPVMAALYAGWWLSWRWGTWKAAAVSGAVLAVGLSALFALDLCRLTSCEPIWFVQTTVGLFVLALVGTGLGRMLAVPTRAAIRAAVRLTRKVRDARQAQ